VSKLKLSLTRALDSGPSLDASQKGNIKRIKTSHIHRANCQLQLQARVSKFKLSLARALDSGPSLDSSEKENKKKFILLTLIGPVASYIFKPECHNSSSSY
jgi:hypothetical protein